MKSWLVFFFAAVLIAFSSNSSDAKVRSRRCCRSCCNVPSISSDMHSAESFAGCSATRFDCITLPGVSGKFIFRRKVAEFEVLVSEGQDSETFLMTYHYGGWFRIRYENLAGSAIAIATYRQWGLSKPCDDWKQIAFVPPDKTINVCTSLGSQTDKDKWRLHFHGIANAQGLGSAFPARVRVIVEEYQPIPSQWCP